MEPFRTRAPVPVLTAVAALLIASACGTDDAADPPPDETDPPATTEPPDTTEPPATTEPPVTTDPPDTTEPDTTEPDTTEPVDAAACTGDETGEAGAIAIVEAAVAGRELNDPAFVEACLTAVPDVFDDTPPACWTACADAERTFRPDAMSVSQVTRPDADPTMWWSVLVPVTYRLADGRFLDVNESWHIDDDGTLREVGINEPVAERDASQAVIADYLAAIERGEWLTAAELLDDGALGLAAERDDLADLDLEGEVHTREEVATALEAWCAAGCDTRAPEVDDLEFTGAFGFTRDERTITAGWFEGVYSVRGLPARTT